MYHAKVAGFDVLFPYEPYGIQNAYMSRMLDCLKNNKNGLLESPTGTGKTLSILCASIAWLESEQEKLAFKKGTSIDDDDLEEEMLALREGKKLILSDRPRVFFSSRTHVQLAQAMKELKRSYYSEKPAVILGSRDQLCIHPEVSKLQGNSLKNQACRLKVAQHACSFHENYEQKASKVFDDSQVIDIEDLVTKGTSNGFCPYYASRLHKNKADVIFTPYNYLLEPSLRKSQGITLENSVVIFDEGHNIESICEDSASCKLESIKLATAIEELDSMLKKAKTDLENTEESQYEDMTSKDVFRIVDEINTLGIENIINLKNILCDLVEAVDEHAIKTREDKPKELPTDWMIEVVREKMCMTTEHFVQALKTIDRVSQIASTDIKPATSSKVAAFDSLNDFFKTIAPLAKPSFDLEDLQTTSEKDFREEFKMKYRLSLSRENKLEKYKKVMSKQWYVANKEEVESASSWTLDLYCLSPSVSINQLISCGVKSIVITSGTLAPFDSFEREMEIPFAVKLENRHVIQEDQLKVRVISKSWNSVVLNSKYDNRENMENYKALGDTIVDYARIIPGGIFVFFSSYSAMTRTIDLWKQRFEWKIWDNLSESKVTFIEPKDKSVFAECIHKYKSTIEESNADKNLKGAIFFGVTRGKLSEGMDVGNEYCRGVIIVGLPFPSCFDARSLLKKSYIESKRDPSFNYQTYYNLQMKRGLNQSIGRIIRHKDDYGVVLLCDSRFSSHKNSLSKWIQPFFKSDGDYIRTRKEITAFFNSRDYTIQPLISATGANIDSASLSSYKTPLAVKDWSASVFQNGPGLKNDMQIVDEYSGDRLEVKPKKPPAKFFEIFKNRHGKRISNGESGAESTKVEIPEKKPSILNEAVEMSSSQERVRKKLKVPLRAAEVKEEPVENSNAEDIDDHLIVQKFISKHGIEIEQLFKGTKKFSRLVQGLRHMQQTKDVQLFISLLRSIFSKVESPQREILLAGMCVLIPKEDRGLYVERLNIKIDYIPMEVYPGNRNMITVKREKKTN